MTAWGKTAEFCNEYMRKGKGAFVEGRLKLDSWQDKEGNKRSKISVVAERVSFAESKSDEGARGDSMPDSEPMASSAAPQRSAPAGGGGDTEDDLPF